MRPLRFGVSCSLNFDANEQGDSKLRWLQQHRRKFNGAQLHSTLGVGGRKCRQSNLVNKRRLYTNMCYCLQFNQGGIHLKYALCPLHS